MQEAFQMNQTAIGSYIAKKRREKNLTQKLERQKNILYGIVLIVLGIACNAMSGTVGGSHVQEFVSGLLMGLSVAEILTGIVIVGKSILKKQEKRHIAYS